MAYTKAEKKWIESHGGKVGVVTEREARKLESAYESKKTAEPKHKPPAYTAEGNKRPLAGVEAPVLSIKKPPLKLPDIKRLFAQPKGLSQAEMAKIHQTEAARPGWKRFFGGYSVV